MAVTDWISPRTVNQDSDGVDGAVAWSNVDNVKTQNDTYATVSLSGPQNGSANFLLCTNFDASSVPVGATIDGMEARVDEYADASNDNGTFQAIDDTGTIVGAFQAVSSPASEDTDTYESVGGSTDKWSVDLTEDMVKNPAFGVSYQTSSGGAVNWFVDHIQIRLYHSGGTVEEPEETTEEVTTTPTIITTSQGPTDSISDPCVPPDCIPTDVPEENPAPPPPAGDPVPIVGVPLAVDETAEETSATTSVSLPALPRDN